MFSAEFLPRFPRQMGRSRLNAHSTEAGHRLNVHSTEEGTVLEMLRNGPMGENKAKRAADTIDSERRLPPRAAFVELLAAPAALFPLEMENKMRPAQPHTNSSFPSRRRREWNGCSTARGTEQP